MNAEEARRLAGESLTPSARQVASLLEFVNGRIEQACKEGRRSIVHPLHGIRTPITPELRQAVRRALEAAGYEWKTHCAARNWTDHYGDSRDPRESDWDEVSW